jgi:hypothetical protein
MRLDKEEISVLCKAAIVDSFKIDNKVFVVDGAMIKTVRLKEEWFDDVEDPERTIEILKTTKPKSDILTFWQRPPDFEPSYSYYMEWENVSLLPMKGFNYWWNKQVYRDIRTKVRKAHKRGVTVRLVDFDDGLVREIMNIFNETQVRRGKPCWNYGKGFETVKREMSRDLDRGEFIGAFYEDRLSGFIKMIYADNIASPVVFLSTIKHRELAPNNALLAKAVELCEQKQIAFITYGAWRRGEHATFLSNNGFEKMRLPRYYVPLTLKGQIVLKLNLHRGIKGILPEKLKEHLLKLRARWYEMKCVKKWQLFLR